MIKAYSNQYLTQGNKFQISTEIVTNTYRNIFLISGWSGSTPTRFQAIYWMVGFHNDPTDRVEAVLRIYGCGETRPSSQIGNICSD